MVYGISIGGNYCGVLCFVGDSILLQSLSTAVVHRVLHNCSWLDDHATLRLRRPGGRQGLRWKGGKHDVPQPHSNTPTDMPAGTSVNDI